MWTSTAKRPHFKLHLKNLPPIYGGLICTSPIYDPSLLYPFLPNCALGNAHTYLQLSTGQAVNNLSRIRPSRNLITDTCDGLPPQLRQNFSPHSYGKISPSISFLHLSTAPINTTESLNIYLLIRINGEEEISVLLHICKPQVSNFSGKVCYTTYINIAGHTSGS